MNNLRRPSRAFTLLEALLTTVIIGVIAAVIAPVIVSAASNIADSGTARTQCENVSYAMDRAIRLLRDCPGGAVAGTLGVSSVTASSITFTDGRGLSLSGTDLMLHTGSGQSDVLLTGVTAFSINSLAENGTTSTATAPTTTQRFEVTIVANGFELRGAAFPRIKRI